MPIMFIQQVKLKLIDVGAAFMRRRENSSSAPLGGILADSMSGIPLFSVLNHH